MKSSNIFLLSLTIISMSCQHRGEREQEYFREQNFESVVIEKYQDWDKHGLECLKLFNCNRDTIVLCLDNWRPDKIWDYVKVGDSLIKPTNSVAITIKRQQNAPRTFRYMEAGI